MIGKGTLSLPHASTSHTRPLCIEQASHSPVSHARRLRPQPQRQALTRRSTASFRYVRQARCYFSLYPPPNTSHGFLHSVFACVSGLGIAHPQSLRCAATVGCAAGFSYNGYRNSHRYHGGLLQSVSVLYGEVANVTMRTCRKRSRGNHTFGTAQDSRHVCLVHLARGHAETILAKRTTRHTRARLPLRTPPANLFSLNNDP